MDRAIGAAFRATDGDVDVAAEALGLSRATMYRRMKIAAQSKRERMLDKGRRSTRRTTTIELMRAIDPDEVATPEPIRPLADVVRDAIVRCVDRHDGNLAAVARELDISRVTLYRRLAEYEAERRDDA